MKLIIKRIYTYIWNNSLIFIISKITLNNLLFKFII